MPIPLIIGGVAALAGVVGTGAAVNGAKKMKDANNMMEETKKRHNKNIKTFEDTSKVTTENMDKLGIIEMETLASFEEFSNIFEKIKNKPEFKSYNKDGSNIPTYTPQELKDISLAAIAILSGLGGAALGTAGGFAAAGATTAAVMALGTASTGTAISALSGAAATNAALAALGGGSIAAGGGGMALGTMVLGGATLGVGLLVGGLIFNFTGNSISEKASDAKEEMLKAEKTINKIVEYLNELNQYCKMFTNAFVKVDKVYRQHLSHLSMLVNTYNKVDWNEYSENEKKSVENLVLLVSLLYSMGKVKLILTTSNQELKPINKSEISKTICDSDNILIKIKQQNQTDNKTIVTCPNCLVKLKLDLSKSKHRCGNCKNIFEYKRP